MDASSIITQVSRDDEQLNTLPQTDKAISPNGKKPRKNVFRNLFCCCFSKPEAQPVGSNGTCVPDEGASINQSCQLPPPAVQPNKNLLPQVNHRDMHKKCMVIDLDETLVHSSFKPISNADFIVPVEIDGTVHQVYVLKRPYVDEFLQKMGELYECVLFTASLAKYADPVANLLDKWNVFRARLFRESCVFHRGNYVKDLSLLGRDLQKVVIMDNSPASYIFHPENAVPVSSWFDDMSDSELIDLVPFLDTLSRVDNVYTVLRNCNNPLSSPQHTQNTPHHHPPTGSSPPLDNLMSNNSGNSLLSQGPITQLALPPPPPPQGPVGPMNQFISGSLQVNGGHQGASIGSPSSAVVSSGSGVESSLHRGAAVDRSGGVC